MAGQSDKGVSQVEIADAIRAAIRAGELVPGQRLVEAELSEWLGASRGAVRGALFDLTHEGLVERIANRGARVRIVTVEEALHITEVRAALEGLCAAKAAERITDDEVETLRALGRDMEGAVAEGDVVRYSQLNQQLHEDVIALARQDVAAEILARLRARNVRHQFGLAFRPGRPQTSLPQHLAIIEAVCTRDPVAADAAVRAHLGSVMEALRAASTSSPLGWVSRTPADH